MSLTKNRLYLLKEVFTKVKYDKLNERFYIELKDYGFAEVGKMYDAQTKGIGGKTFYSHSHKAVLKKGKFEIIVRGEGWDKKVSNYSL